MKELEVVEQMMQAMENLDPDTLKHTLAYLLKVYVLDKRLAYDGAVNELTRASSGSTLPRNFVELMIDLKRNCQMEELNQFSIEGGKVFIKVDGKRYQISVDDDSAMHQPHHTRQTEKKKNHGDGGGMKSNRFRNLEMDD